MRKTIVIALLAFCALPLFAAGAADEAADAERAFAKAFADRDVDRFFSFVAEDAHFLGGAKTLKGRSEVREGWLPYLTAAKAPFSWKPERVVANAAGDLALSTGPVFDETGKHIADYISTWQKQPDGSWKVIFDGPGIPLPCPKETRKE